MLNLFFELSKKSLVSHLHFLYRKLRKTKVSAGLTAKSLKTLGARHGTIYLKLEDPGQLNGFRLHRVPS